MRQLWKPQVFVTALALACGVAWLIMELVPRNKPESAEPATRKIEALAERECACTNADCARAVLHEFSDLAPSMNHSMDVTQGIRDRLVAAGHKLGACAKQLGLTATEMRDTFGKFVAQ